MKNTKFKSEHRLKLESHRVKNKRNIGKELLNGIEEIKKWQEGSKKLKLTHVFLSGASDPEKNRQLSDSTKMVTKTKPSSR
jgi:hypothetical protein